LSSPKPYIPKIIRQRFLITTLGNINTLIIYETTCAQGLLYELSVFSKYGGAVKDICTLEIRVDSKSKANTKYYHNED
jgi:hypothetical protein